MERATQWPDALHRPNADHVAALLTNFWLELEGLPALLHAQEFILAEALTAHLRRMIMELMLAMNGIAWPKGTLHLNGYLGASQRAVLERTLVAPESSGDTWLARAVALVVIYRWYAPQCTERFGVAYPQAAEAHAWATLCAQLPNWPATLTTE